METPFDILSLLVKRKSYPAWKKTSSNLSYDPRFMFIFDTLHSWGVDTAVDTWDIGGIILSNIEATLGPDTDESEVVFMAHYDIVNPDSENAQDNSASVANLLYVIKELLSANLQRRVRVVFTDHEEVGLVGAGAGAERWAESNPDAEVINLELTGRGEHIWCSTFDDFNPLEGVPVQAPLNDSYILSHMGVRSCCIGLLEDQCLMETVSVGHCDTWDLCHSKRDSLNLIVPDDMQGLCDLLIEYAKHTQTYRRIKSPSLPSEASSW